uniref:Uncharacterized protein n=1 Tax=Oryzias latipes TaxID=8090 RepID=A0A3P9LU32_ORYLA
LFILIIFENLLSGILKTTKLPPSNITKKEMAAIHSLKNNREITILSADKGRTTVILDTEQYEKQMNEILPDWNTYEVLKRDPTEAKKKKLNTILKQHNDCPSCYRHPRKDIPPVVRRVLFHHSSGMYHLILCYDRGYHESGNVGPIRIDYLLDLRGTVQCAYESLQGYLPWHVKNIPLQHGKVRF